uniref:Mitogen-activated protein kinase kinase kinase n=1 Tax=Panagrolaimus sp. JU765 TaxID=591449 RepID=A0AC34QRH2_9BILA
MHALKIEVPTPGPSADRQFSNDSTAGSIDVTRHSLSSTNTTIGDDYETVDDTSVEWPIFNKANQLGHGSYGTVVEVRFKGRRAALKMLAPNVSHKAVSTEAKLLHFLSHRNIIELYAVYKSGDKTGLLLELMPGGSLHQLLHNHRQVRYYADHALGWAFQSADALAYLHGQGCLHRDLKPSNMLLSDNFIDLKLCDFGTAAHLKTTMTNNRGSAAYMAPEVFQYSKYDQKCDIYSFGISFWEMLARKLPVDDGEPYQVLWQATTQNRRPPRLQNVPEPLMDLIERCWHKDAKERPDIEEVKDIIEILMESCGNRFKPLIDLTTNRPALASTLNDPVHITFSAPGRLDEIANENPPRKPSAPQDEGERRSDGAPPVPPRPSIMTHRRSNSGAYPVSSPLPGTPPTMASTDNGYSSFTPTPGTTIYTPSPSSSHSPYPIDPNYPIGPTPIRPIGFAIGVPPPYIPPYQPPFSIPPPTLQAPPPICTPVSPGPAPPGGDIGFRRTSEPNYPANMGNGYCSNSDTSPNGTETRRPKKKLGFLQKLSMHYS